ncbi:MAG: calcium-binding EGF-like domain-containing protein [Chitinophagaceae bacterium]
MNARLRSILLTATIVTTGFAAVFISSCAEDKCKALVCANGGVCNQGACICPSGYEGPQCETDNRTRFLNGTKSSWNVQEDGSESPETQYPISIVNGDGPTQILIKNFNNFFPEAVKARVKGDTMYIDPQTFPSGSVVGQGYIMDDKYYGVDGQMIVRYQTKDTNGIVNDYGYNPGATNVSVWTK